MTNIRENNTTDIICEQDKLELFDEIMCKIQSKKKKRMEIISHSHLYNQYL